MATLQNKASTKLEAAVLELSVQKQEVGPVDINRHILKQEANANAMQKELDGV